MSDKPSIEFVNDIERIEWAVGVVYQEFYCADGTPGHYINIINDELAPELDMWEAVRTIAVYVPKLIENYEQLFALSMDLVALKEAEARNQTPQGLYLPPTTVQAPQPR